MGGKERRQLVLTVRSPRMFRNIRAPGLYLGALLFAPLAVNSAAGEASLRLARDLYDEGQWEVCRTEAVRCLAAAPGQHQAALLKALADLKLGRDAIPDLRRLSRDSGVDPGLRCRTRLELGRALWIRKRDPEAFTHLRAVFRRATDPLVFLVAGCSLAHVVTVEPDLAADDPALIMALDACEHLWTERVQEAAAFPSPKGTASPAARIPMVIVRFYQRQISPAIGQRCSLDPSCSAYACQALRTHGLLGLAMYADRAVREPGIVAEQERPVIVNGRRKYRDPLHEHDHWLGEAP